MSFCQSCADLESRLREVEAERDAAKEDAALSWDCIHMIASDCLVPHLGEEEVKKIAPMFYPEAISNAMRAIMEKETPGIIEKARRVEQAEAQVTALRAEVAALTAALADADVLVQHYEGYALTAAVRANISDLRVGVAPEIIAAGERYAARTILARGEGK